MSRPSKSRRRPATVLLVLHLVNRRGPLHSLRSLLLPLAIFGWLAPGPVRAQAPSFDTIQGAPMAESLLPRLRSIYRLARRTRAGTGRHDLVRTSLDELIELGEDDSLEGYARLTHFPRQLTSNPWWDADIVYAAWIKLLTLATTLREGKILEPERLRQLESVITRASLEGKVTIEQVRPRYEILRAHFESLARPHRSQRLAAVHDPGAGGTAGGGERGAAAVPPPSEMGAPR